MGDSNHKLFGIFFRSTDALAAAYATMTYGFAAFCLTASFLLGRLPVGQSRRAARVGAPAWGRSASKYRFVSLVALRIALVLTVATTIIMYMSGIGVMGVEGVTAPFRLVGLVFYTRLVFIPAILLLVVWSSQQAGLQKRMLVALALLLVYGLVDMLLRSSRSGLAGLLLPLGFLFLASGQRVNRRQFMFLAGGMLLVAFLYPVISVYRGIRIAESNDILSAIISAQGSIVGGGLGDLLATMGTGVRSLLFRLTGVDMLIVYHGLGVQALGDQAWNVLTAPRGLSGYVTVDVFGFSSNDINAEAPSLVGWFFLVGGHTLVVVGLAGFTAAAYALWRILIRMRLRSLPVAQALFLALLFTQATEGTFDSLIGLPILAWPASIAGCEWLVRRVETRR